MSIAHCVVGPKANLLFLPSYLLRSFLDGKEKLNALILGRLAGHFLWTVAAAHDDDVECGLAHLEIFDRDLVHAILGSRPARHGRVRECRSPRPQDSP